MTGFWQIQPFMWWHLELTACPISYSHRGFHKHKMSVSWEHPSACVKAFKMNLLAPVQKAACKRNLALMPIVVSTARRVSGVCQETFHNHRWNCSSIDLAPRFGQDLVRGEFCRCGIHQGGQKFYRDNLDNKNSTFFNCYLFFAYVRLLSINCNIKKKLDCFLIIVKRVLKRIISNLYNFNKLLCAYT